MSNLANVSAMTRDTSWQNLYLDALQMGKEDLKWDSAFSLWSGCLNGRFSHSCSSLPQTNLSFLTMHHWCCSLYGAGTPVCNSLLSQTQWPVQEQRVESPMASDQCNRSLNWCGPTGTKVRCVKGQTSVTYAIVETFTPICSTVCHIVLDTDWLQCTLDISSPLPASLAEW